MAWKKSAMLIDLQANLDRIISGGQTGADRGALDAALDLGFKIAGYCPHGRKAADGPLAPRYTLTELGGGYRQRTRENVRIADVTAIFYDRQPEGGTELTVSFCIKEQTSYRLIDMALVTPAEAAAAIIETLQENGAVSLNVAGPSDSTCVTAYGFVYETVCQLILLCRQGQ